MDPAVTSNETLKGANVTFSHVHSHTASPVEGGAVSSFTLLS